MTHPRIQARRIARQLVETDWLLGLDTVPLGNPDVLSTDGTEEANTVLRSKQDRLEQLRQRHDRECPHCTSATYHTRTVFGEGHADAQIMFIGEAPGAEEDRSGRPFVGRAGQLLERMINAMGLAREDVYIANVLKSRPPDNATPTPMEIEKCSPYLVEQILIIEPEVIVAVGAPSAKLLLDTRQGISKLRGRWHDRQFGNITIPVMPTFHPAYLLRQYTPENRKKVWCDLQMVMERVGLPLTSSPPSN